MHTLLLADDSVTIQRVIELTFAEEGVRVIVAQDGETAIARMDAERPDIVLADVGMPRVDGYQVVAHMKQTPALARVPVLLLAGAFEPIDEARARQVGCDGVLVKPFEPRHVLTQVRALLAGARPADLWPVDMPRVDARPVAPAARPAPRPAPQPAPRPAPQPAQAPPPRSLQVPPQRQAPAFDSMAEPGPMPSAPPVEAEFELGLDDLDLAFSRLDPVAAPGRLDADTVSDFQRDIREHRSTMPDEPLRERVPAAPDLTEAMAWDLPLPPVPPEHVYELPPVPQPRPIAYLPPVAEARFAPAPDVDQIIDLDPIVEPEVTVEPAPAVEAPPPPLLPPPPPPPEPPAPPTLAIVEAVDEPAPAPIPASAQPAPTPALAPPASLAAAFSALLAAEQVQPQLRQSPAGSPALSDVAVEEVVRRVVTRMTDEMVRKVVLETAERLIREEIDRIKT